MIWRKSTFSHPNDCVEVAWPVGSTAVRDSKNTVGPVLVFGRAQFACFSAKAASPVHLSPHS
jgi:uncharacterized protein DUF397